MLVRQKGTPPKGLVENYKEWSELQGKLGQTVLKLMRHPDSTLEQLWGLRLTYADDCESFNEMRKQLRTMYWNGSGYMEKYPWNQ
jgi:hypothetical protein